MAGLSPEDIQRYSRQIILPEVTESGQQQLADARVLCVGAGGLGSPLALYLAAAGIGTLGLVDFDRVDLSNIQRQVLYASGDVGRPKLEAARERLTALNPATRVVAHPVRLTSDNVMATCQDYDILVDGSDNFPTRYLLNDAAVLLGKPLVHASVFRFEGQLSVFDATRGPCYRCLFPEPPPEALVPSCAEGGVLGMLPGILGCMQALEVVKLVLSRGEPLRGRLLMFDGLAMRWRELPVAKDPDCPLCGDKRTIHSPQDMASMQKDSTTDTELPRISVQELARQLASGQPPVVLDVREPAEFSLAHIPGARLIPLAELPGRLDELNPDHSYVVTCQKGPRGERACSALRQAGFSRLLLLEGGVEAWVAHHGFPP